MNWSRIAQAVGFLILLIIVGAFVLQAFPQLVGADHSLVVQSGSMEPAIKTGAVVFITQAPPEEVAIGDVITYSDDGGNLVTHRVVDKISSTTSFRWITKGDANEDPDAEPVYHPDYVGTVMFHIPLIGYIISFSQTRLGWGLMVVVPVMLLILSELWSLWKAGTTEVEDG